jgi:hypothetical protein
VREFLYGGILMAGRAFELLMDRGGEGSRIHENGNRPPLVFGLEVRVGMAGHAVFGRLRKQKGRAKYRQEDNGRKNGRQGFHLS